MTSSRPGRARAGRAAFALGALVGLAACSRGRSTEAIESSATESAAASARPTSTVPSAATSTIASAPAIEGNALPAAASAHLTRLASEEAAWRGAIRSAKSIGNTSVVFKVDLEGGRRAAFRADYRRGPGRYKGEIAAHRLGLALGLENVPAAYPRAVARAELASAVRDAAGAKLVAEEIIVHGGVARGAIVPWIDRLEILPIERDDWRTKWKAWTGAGEVPDDDRALAAQISTLIAFDYVTGNWDRWSGGNVGIDRAAGRLLFIDNDGAFFETPPPEALARNERTLRAVDRFSRAFIDRLRALDDAALVAAIGEESPGKPLLSTAALAGVSTRRRALLAVIDGKRAAAGDEATFAFP